MTGWTKIGTNRMKFAEWLHEKYRVDLILGLFAQGQSLVKAIDAVKPGVAVRKRVARSAADIMKGKLTKALNNLLGKPFFLYILIVHYIQFVRSDKCFTVLFFFRARAWLQAQTRLPKGQGPRCHPRSETDSGPHGLWRLRTRGQGGCYGGLQ